MARFKTSVYERDGRWWFRWWNADVISAQGLVGPCNNKGDAETEMLQFVEAEKKKRRGRPNQTSQISAIDTLSMIYERHSEGE